MNDETILVSIMAVNNEIGVKQPIKEIGALFINSVIWPDHHLLDSKAVIDVPLDRHSVTDGAFLVSHISRH